MIDQEYIRELEALLDTDKKEAKEKLAEYALTFDIKVKKTKAFDVMLREIKAELQSRLETPMPELNEGLSINDLITAADSADDKITFDDVNETAASLVSEFIADNKDETSTESEANDLQSAYFEAEIDESVPEETIEVEVEKVEEPAVISDGGLYTLPSNFSPTVRMLGKNPGYCTLPWWIYDWISQNPDWKNNPNRCPHYHAISVLLSLIYYIRRDGSVQIRETRNSKFFTLS